MTEDHILAAVALGPKRIPDLVRCIVGPPGSDKALDDMAFRQVRGAVLAMVYRGELVVDDQYLVRRHPAATDHNTQPTKSGALKW